MMGCRALAKSTGQPCKNVALAGGDLCEWHQDAEDRGELVARIPASLADDRGGDPPTGEAVQGGEGPEVIGDPLPSPADLPAEFAELPDAPVIEAEAVAQGEPDAAPAADADLWRLDAIAATLFGGPVPEDPAELEEEAPAPGLAGAVAAASSIGGRWDPSRVAMVLGWCSVAMERTGKPALTPGEIREGSEVLAPVFDRLFGSIDPANPYAAATLWVALTFGTRYAGELAAGVRWLVGRIRPRRSAAPRPAEEPAPVSRPAEDPAPRPAPAAAVLEGWT